MTNELEGPYSGVKYKKLRKKGQQLTEMRKNAFFHFFYFVKIERDLPSKRPSYNGYRLYQCYTIYKRSI